MRGHGLGGNISRTHPDAGSAIVVRMGRAWLERPGAAIPAIFPARPERKAAYRLLSSGKVSMEHILEPHRATMVERCQLEDIVLAIQDTTTLRTTTGSKRPKASSGWAAAARARADWWRMWVWRSTRPGGRSACSPSMRASATATPEIESERWLRGHERAQELARACPATRVVTVCDREGDHLGVAHQGRIARRGLLVRARRSAQRRVILERRGGERVGACRRSPAPCRQDRGDRRLRRQAGAPGARQRWSCAPPGSVWRHRATPRAGSRSTCSSCPRPNPTRPPARTRSTGCC